MTKTDTLDKRVEVLEKAQAPEIRKIETYSDLVKWEYEGCPEPVEFVPWIEELSAKLAREQEAT